MVKGNFYFDDQYLLSALSAFIAYTHTHPIVKDHSDYNFNNYY